jgi:hypothetical protein
MEIHREEANLIGNLGCFLTKWSVRKVIYCPLTFVKLFSNASLDDLLSPKYAELSLHPFDSNVWP